MKKSTKRISKDSLTVTDTETTGLSPEHGHRIFLSGITGHPIDWNKEKYLKLIKGKTLIIHNSKFDLKMFLSEGIDIGPVHDTFILAKLWPINFASYELESLSEALFGTKRSEKDVLKEWLDAELERRRLLFKEYKKTGFKKCEPWVYKNSMRPLVKHTPTEWDKDIYKATYEEIPKKIMKPYFEKDLTNPRKIFDKFYPQLEGDLKTLYETECKCANVIAHMEHRGHLIDKKYLESIKVTLQEKSDKLIKEIRDTVNYTGKEPFNPKSKLDMQWLIYKKLKLPVIKKTAKDDLATDSKLLKLYKLPLLDKIIDYNRTITLNSTFVEGILNNLDLDNCLHTNYNQFKVTGRLSSYNPCLQNIPTERKDKEEVIRKAFIPRKGYTLAYFDYSQIEPLLTAVTAQEERMLQIIREGGDIHQMVADACGIPRGPAKSLGLAITYGMGHKAILDKMIELGVEEKDFTESFQKDTLDYEELMKEDKQSAWDLIKKYWQVSKSAPMLEEYLAQFPAIKQFKYEASKAAKNRLINEGQAYVITMFGRRNLLQNWETYKAVNYIIQGSAADIMKIAMVKVFELLKGKDAHILLTIHDELIVELKDLKLIKSIKETMEDFDLGVPLRVKIKISKKNWGERSEYKC